MPQRLKRRHAYLAVPLFCASALLPGLALLPSNVSAETGAQLQMTAPTSPLSIAEWNHLGEWRFAQRYERGDVVTFAGGSFIALQNNRRKEPVAGNTTEDWGLLAAPGDTGPEGPEGRRGPRGAIGPEGPEGARGPRGLVGPEGQQGPQGQRGPRGNEGPAGPMGPAGVVAFNFGKGADRELEFTGYRTIVSLTLTAPSNGFVWINADYGVRFSPLNAPQAVTCMVNSNDAGFNGASYKFTAIETTSVIQDQSGSVANFVPITAGQHDFVLRCFRSELTNATTQILFSSMTLMFFEQSTP